uniref:Putative LAGLIDADG homing endonuclease n=1 Tax=Koliella corcontica TaxID=155904 RepID=A0A097KMY8_9CHLO|nr:putative LAGLIDADG homing endonuclease [Koliella corcontica]YP_009105843.1 putative LAGLIDADG homing endonuclease [Koliella corcontica]AIT94539.1 putative LAGLIDADG homing endonuclease [Koliella corcontica]AIT94545.1 putative LAGLIDADG homing endonuclease [Koliella corcontica]
MNIKLRSFTLNPFWVTGFVDGEGCFCVSFNKRASLKMKLEVRPSFSLGQHERSVDTLKSLQEFFNTGGIRYDKKEGSYKYEVRDLKSLNEKIIPHFEKYQLISAKKEDFERFKIICLLMKNSKHLNRQGLMIIIENAVKMNQSGKRKYLKEDLLRICGEVEGIV